MITTGATSAGGGEKHALELADGLVRRGHQVMLVAPGGGDVLDTAEALGCETFALDSFAPFAISSRRRLGALIEQWKPDLVHAHGPRSAYAVRRQASDGTVPLVYTIHGIHAGHGPLGSVKLAVERHDLGKVDAFIVTCKADLEQGAELGILNPERTTLIYNGVAEPVPIENGLFRAEYGIDPDTLLIAHVGRISPPKDHPTLLRAFDTAWKRSPADAKPHFVMVAAGTPRQRDQLARKIDCLTCKDAITLLPALDDLGPLYTDADIFVLSSLWEARPYVLVEAMQHACAVVSTDVGGVGEVVADGETGFLVPPQRPDLLADALQSLRANPPLRALLAHAGQAFIADRFPLDTMVEQTIEVYRHVVTKPDSRPSGPHE